MIEQLLADAPTSVRVVSDGRTHDARKTSARRWETDGVEVAVRGADPATVTLASGRTPVEEVVLRWRTDAFASPANVYGDEWERGYGGLMWQPVVPERVLPWYFLAAFGGAPGGDGAMARVLAVGVGVAPAAFASWCV
ncbi:MAG: hypothetical protein ACOC7V_16830, partial [Spirochaetota bacterium]